MRMSGFVALRPVLLLLAANSTAFVPSFYNSRHYCQPCLNSKNEDVTVQDEVRIGEDALPTTNEGDLIERKLNNGPFREQRQQPKLSANDMMRAMGTSPRRIALSVIASSGIALVGNFLGVTSRLLTTIPEDMVEASGVDTYFPRGDFKRCRSRGYTLVIPKEWVADTFVELAKAQRNTRPLDYQMKRGGGGGITLPDSAYGPPGRLNQKGVSESGDTNVSVIVTPNLNGFSLKGTLGAPTEAAEKLLRISIAPEGSGRVATLLNAVEDPTRNVYQFEYLVDRGSKGAPLRNISVVAASASGDKLYTMTVVAPEQKWNDISFAEKLRKVAASFHLTQ